MGVAWVFLFAGLGITRERCGCPSIEPYPENLSAWGHSPHDTEVHPTIQMGSAYWGNDISILRCVIKYVRASAYLIICNTYYTCTYLSMGWFKENFTGTPPDFMGKTDASCRFSLKPINESIVFLVGGLDHFFIFHFIYGMSSFPTDFHIFQRRRSTTNQYWFNMDFPLLVGSMIINYIETSLGYTG